MLISVMCFFAVLTANAQYSEDDLLKEANALFEQGQYAKAMPLYSQLLSLNPTKPEFNYKYGATALYGDADKKEEAIKFLRYASTKNGIDNKCWYFLGRAYHLNYQFADAIHAYNKYKVLAGNKASEALGVDREIEDCRNGQNLLSKIKEVKVLNKKQSTEEAFFRIYDLKDIGGKILVTPEVLLSSLDKKRNQKSLIHFRGTGTTVYFSSYGKDGENGLDIYSAEVLPGGSFSDPVLLGPSINTPYDEDYPFMHPDNSTFYFSSKGHSSMGGYDVFKSTYVGGSFSSPENLDFAINTPDDDLFYIADSLKNMAYFASARSSKQGELHVYKVLVSSVPADITFVKGNFINRIALDNKLAKITVVDASTNKVVDVQYTDPQTGDYVLSFPRSGRFKLSVEAEKSDRIHAGIVEIPKSSGITAYLQEMELVSSAGVEKLLINNLFDQQYDGDVAALAQKMLRQRAALDVNFNAQEETEPEPEVEEKVDNIALAYNAAGFGAGLSNEKVLEASQKRKTDLSAKKEKINDLKLAAQQYYFQAVSAANTQSKEAKDLIAQAATMPEEKRGEVMFKAGIAKMEAENALREADNTSKLINELNALEKQAAEAEQEADNQSKALDAALNSADYNTALEALKAEKSIQEKQDRTNRDFDAIDQMQITSVQSRNDAQKFLDRASSIRSQADDAETRLHNKTRQREKLTGKDAKALDAEISRLTEEADDAKNRATKAFEQAAKVQEESYDKKQQFEILSQINKEVNTPNYQAPQSTSISAANKETLTSLESEVANLEIDGKQVSAYLKDNPQATANFDSDQKELAFKRAYAVDGADLSLETNDEIAVYENPQEEVAIANAIGNNNQQTAAENEDGINETESDEHLSEAKPNQIDKNPIESSADADELASGDLGESKTEVSNADVNQINENGEKTTEAPFAESEKPKMKTQEDTESTFAEAQKEKVKTKEATESTFAEAENTTKKQTENDASLADNTSAKENTKSDKALTGVSTENKIAAENVKIEAAEDWISIIDASIADLERGVGGDENENIEEQLEQYQALKGTKEKEIALSKSKISELKGEMTLADDGAEDVVDQPENESVTALARAELDLESLSVSHIARLEMKVADAYSDKKYEKKISKIDTDYLSEIAAAELSGNSDPEIALDRIKLNTKFIESVDQLIRGEGVSDLKTEDLIELRRIKSLEIRQDRLVETGEMAYKPHTTKAVEYAALMSEPVSNSDLRGDSNLSEAENELTGLSPEFAAELRAPYSRNVLLGDYDVELQKIEAENSGMVLLAERIALNKAYLSSLQAELQMYSAALEGESNPKNAELIQGRYQILLAERSAVVDEIDADQKEIKALTEIEEDVVEEPLEVFIESEPEEVPGRDAMPVAIEPSPNYVRNIEESFNEQISAIEANELIEKERLERVALLNATTALKIDSLLVELVAKLDIPGAALNKDSLQVQIQLLDAIAADKRQESDRLINEAEMLTLADNSISNADATVAETANTENLKTVKRAELTNRIEVSDLESEWIDVPVIAGLKYKSLNANISRDRMDPMIDSLNLMTSNARNLVTAINASSDINEQAESLSKLDLIKKQISDLQNRLTSEISKSNTAEISYFQNSNNALISRLKEFKSEVKTENKIESFSREIANLNRSFSEIETRAERKEISENERIESENKLIAGLSLLNTTLEREVKNVEPEVISVEMAATEIERNAKSEPLLEAMMENPDNYKPEPGKTYITPIHRLIETDLNENQKIELAKKDQALAIDYSFILKPTPESDTRLIESSTKIDERGLKLLESNPDQFRYLLSSLGADSLKRMETRQAAYAKKMDSESIEKFAEVKRLEGIIVHEENPNVKQELQTRVNRIIAEATVNYQKSSMATFQAEKLRNLRKEQESEVVAAASDLSGQEIAEMNQIMDRETYTVVPSDFASAEMSKSNTSKPKKNSRNKVEDKDSKPDLTTAEIEKPEENAASSSSKESVANASTVDAAADVMPINENLSSIDEKLLLEAHGNWLNVFEIIAEKDDFSDVKESLFVKSEGSVYSDKKPIPVDPVMPGGLVFQVQVGAFRNSIPQDLYGDFAPIMGQELPNGITRYRAGIFRTYKAAITARNQIREKGYSDAFVVAYVDGERLTGTQAQQILEQTRVAEGMTVAETLAPKPAGTSQPTGSSAQETGITAATEIPRTDYYNDPEAAEANLVEATTGLFYTVQVGVYSKPVKLDALFNLVELNSELTSTGYIRYTSGRYTSPETAGIRKAEVIEKGVGDAFITAYYNGKRISISKAQSIFVAEGTSALSPAIGKKPAVGKVDSSGVNTDVVKKDDIKYVVILGSYAGAVPQNVANVFLERSDLKIRRVTAPNGISIYASPEFESKAEAEEFLKLSLAAGVNSAVMGKVVNGVISAVDSR
ncbi:hypothetical protein G3O08_09485 [Cryomorpha ignava]|uniref:Tetratricopeptide repeat protein n=1 Tax=Cryomorpha ignava TaxID=101383 RepID=A0A7K3WRQ1_9FLAO|nr:PD40 domain-containing protein [Cryomorpha ignava]NEN23731.1 hypothetical protein [Cryomorpha ignava]